MQTRTTCILYSEYLRGSVLIELVAVLDVEHQVSSVDKLHHEEQVLLKPIAEIDLEVRSGNFSSPY